MTASRFSFAALALAMASLGAHAAIQIDSCGNITASGSYQLKKNLSAASGACIVVSAPNVVLDLGGFAIRKTGTNSDTAVSARNGLAASVTVRNGTIAGYAFGVVLPRNSVVENVSFEGVNSAIDLTDGRVQGNNLVDVDIGVTIGRGIVRNNLMRNVSNQAVRQLSALGGLMLTDNVVNNDAGSFARGIDTQLTTLLTGNVVRGSEHPITINCPGILDGNVTVGSGAVAKQDAFKCISLNNPV